MARMPAAELDVTPDLVRDLLAAQHPDLLEGREISVFANGWDNAMLRLGDDLLVRLPRRELAARLVEHEQAWLPLLADRLPAPIPAPVRTGVPSPGYPWSWSVLPWLPGHPLASATAPEHGETVAAELGRFLAALHTPAPGDVWTSPYRGGPLRDRRPDVEGRIREHATGATQPLLDRWSALIALPDPPDPRLWVHGDAHPLNVLVEAGHLAAVIDWGDLCAGDPAGDLIGAWLAFDPPAADAMRAAYDDAATHSLDLDQLWLRAEAWAIHITTMILANSEDHPDLDAVGRFGLHRLTG